MEPRLPSSKKWTSAPKELLAQIVSVLKQSFPKQSVSGVFIAEGRIYPEEVLLRLGYREAGRLVQSNFEASITYNRAKDPMLKIIHLAVDSGGSLLTEFINDPDKEFPREWKEYIVENRTVYLRYTTINSELEAEADKLLGSDDENLLNDADEEDLQAKISLLGLNDED